MDTIRMDTNPLSAGGADAAADTVDEQDRMLPLGRRKGNPFPERVFRPAGGREMGLKCLLTHRCSLRDKTNYRASFYPPEIAMTAPTFDLEIASHRPPDSAVLQDRRPRRRRSRAIFASA